MNKSLVARFLCGSAVFALVALPSHAQVSDTPDDRVWIERSRAILEDSAERALPEWLRAQPSEAALEDAGALLEPSRSSHESADATRASRVLIFGSFSIPPETLKSLLDQATEPEVVFVLRGIPQGSSITAAVRQLNAMLPKDERVPHVILDPTLFRRYSIERVPTFVLERGDHRPPIIAVGAVNVKWLRRMAVAVQPGAERMGHRAESYDIAERDLITEMQQRLAAVDWTAKREAAIEHFWARPTGTVELPDARETREFVVDPTVRVTEDLEDADGQVLVAAGETFNPLRWVPLSKIIIVFRGTDARHVATVAELVRNAQTKGRGVILLTTALESAGGWRHLAELEQTFGASVYLLPRELVERFHLRHVPATVSARGSQLVVHEVPAQVTP